MADKVMSNNALKNLQWGMHDAVIDGNLVRDIPSKMIFVTEENELYAFNNIYPVGTLAATYGFGSLWQLDADREWIDI